MTSTSDQLTTAHLSVRNVGGIDDASLSFESGVNVLTGRNATNRTSALQALMAALGSDRATLKADADEGSVELDIGSDTHTRSFRRSNGTVTTSGDPLLEDPTLADLYAFLLENNEARQSVARKDDLRDVIMRPVDTDEIQAEIDRLEDRKRELSDRLDELGDLERRLPTLVEEETRLTDELEEKRAALEAKRREIADTDVDVEETREDKAELETKLEELQSIRSSLDDVRFDVETERESIDRLREELDDYRSQRADLPDESADEPTDLDATIDRLRRRRQSLESDISELQSILRFNEEMLDGHDSAVLDSLVDGDASGDGPVTDRLVEGEEVTCWTCGTTVNDSKIETMTDRLRSFLDDKREERAEVDDRLSELTAERDEIAERLRERERIERKIERAETEIADRQERIEELRSEREELEAEMEAVEAAVESLRTEEYDEILDLHQEANRLEFECERLSDDVDDVRDEIASIEERLDERAAIEDQRTEIQDELEELRTRVDRIEREAVDAFNEHMADLLEVLGFTNIERIWLERTEARVREGRRKVTKSQFELHIVRSTDSGSAYEDTIDHLSESEREVTGLVFALAGYLVHDVHEVLPFMLLDSLEAIDAERIADLIDYFESFVDFVVVALLHEDAQALDDDYRRITDI